MICQQKHIGQLLKIIISIYLPMKNRLRFYQELRSGLNNLSNSYFEFQNHRDESESNYETAKQILMSIPDQNYGEKLQAVDLRTANNGSDITRWNQHRQNTQNKENQVKIKKSHKNRCRHISSQNSFVQNQHSQFTIGYSLKKELNKLKLPLKEKNINQEQFRNSEREKQRNKTRNQIKLDIINSKFELAPTIPNRRKTHTEHNYENIVKLKTENNNYHRIRRKGIFTIDLQIQKSHQESYIKNLSRTRQKAFFLKNQLENNPRLRQRSVHHIFACIP